MTEASKALKSANGLAWKRKGGVKMGKRTVLKKFSRAPLNQLREDLQVWEARAKNREAEAPRMGRTEPVKRPPNNASRKRSPQPRHPVPSLRPRAILGGRR